MIRRPARLRRRKQRQGLALLLVLFVVAVLTFAVYQFADTMLAHAAFRLTDERFQREHSLARSACEAVLAAQSPVTHDTLPGEFAVFHYAAQLGDFRVQRGLADESAKLNLHVLPLAKVHQLRARAMLMHLPGMTEPTADAILDWLDADDELRPLGAETSYYTTCAPPYRAANAPLRSLDELLLVRGVTRELLYGPATSEPVDGDSRRGAERGWNRYLTVLGCERNVTREGHARIDLNDPQLARLYDRLLPAVGAERARFVVALRLAGPWLDESEVSLADAQVDEVAMAEARIEAQTKEPLDEPDVNEVTAPVERAGFDLRSPPMFRIRSLVDLWGTKVRILNDGRDELLESPWKRSPEALRRLLSDDAEQLTTFAAATIAGRVNINVAPQEVLLAVPGMTRELAQAIANRQRDAAGVPWGDRLPSRNTLTWLLDEGVLNGTTLRDLAPYLTCEGDVHQGQIACRVQGSRTAGHFRVIVDQSRSPATVRRLHYLGMLPQNEAEQLFSSPSMP